MHPDDEKAGQLMRLLRRRAALTQEALSQATAVPVRDIARVEAGLAGLVGLGRIRRLFGELDARARLSVWWHGAAADRLLDEKHAQLADHGAQLIARYGWLTPLEVTYSEYGERGSIDILAHRELRRAVAVCEVKSAFGSLEEMNRTLDVKVRLAPAICRQRFGWAPEHVARLLIVPGVSSVRRVVAAHRHTMDALYPARGRQIRAWLRRPVGDLGGIWFLSDPPDTQAVTADRAVDLSFLARRADPRG